MRINLDYLKQFIDHEYDKEELKELLASIGIEVDEMINVNGTDVFEVEITPNRPDWLSHYGIAREILAKNPSLKLRKINPERIKSSDASDFQVEIKDKKGCLRYSGAILENIKVAESSQGMKQLIESFGLRPVNNIVDISNIILMTYGHPIHIFDLDRLRGKKVIIRNAHKDEELTLLDGSIRKFDETDLMIADEEGAVAAAGVMGGEYSGVNDNTKTIFIESAMFDPSRVRRTSKKLGMKTDASFLFERGADIGNTDLVINNTIDLILKETGGSPNVIKYYDEYPEKFKKQIVKLEKSFPSSFTGIQIGEKISCEILEGLGFKLIDRSDHWDVEVPSFRVDINGHEDLVEEIIRIYGYDKLNAIIPGTITDSVETYEKRLLLDDMRAFFNSIGYSEVINYSFHSITDNSFFGSASDNVEIKNPIGSDYSVMRNSMAAGLLKNTVTNWNNDFKRVSLFESGTIFKKVGEDIDEKDVVTISASGYETLPNWQNSKGRMFDFFLFKSHVLNYLRKAGFNAKIEKGPEFSEFLNDESCFGIRIDEKKIGFIGQIKEKILKHFKSDEPVYICQLDLDIMTGKKEEKNFRIWNRMPAATRDLSFLINREYLYNSIIEAIEKFRPADLEDYSLTSLYEGKGVPQDKISMLMNFRYRSIKKTLTTDEVNDLHDSLTSKLSDELGIIRR